MGKVSNFADIKRDCISASNDSVLVCSCVDVHRYANVWGRDVQTCGEEM